MNEGAVAGATAGGPRQPRRARILVVDDEKDLRDALRQLLSSALDCDVVTAASGEEALKIAKDTPFDVAVCDYKMPGMDGLEFLARLSRLLPHVPRIMITAYPDQNLAIQAINEARIDTFLTKPLDPGHVVRACGELLHGRASELDRQTAFARAMGARDEEAARPGNGSRFAASLERLLSQEGVDAALLVGRDGRPVCSRSRAPIDVDTASAMAAAAVAAADVAGTASGVGVTVRMDIKTTGGRFVLTAVGDDHLLVLRIGDRRGKVYTVSAVRLQESVSEILAIQ